MSDDHDRASLGRRAAGGLVWSATGTYVTQVLRFGILTLLTRLVAPEQFGLVAYALVFIAVADVFVNMGFAEALIQRTELEEGHLHTGFWLQVGSGIGMMTLLYIAAPAISHIFQEPRLVFVLRAMSPYFVLTALSKIPGAVLARGLRFRAIAMRELVGAVCGGIVAVGLALYGFAAGALVAQLLVATAAGAVTLWLASEYRPRLQFSLEHARDLIRFGVPVVGIAITNFLNVRFQDLVVGYWLGPLVLGYFTIAMRVLWLINSGFGGIANAVGLPAFSRMEGDRSRLSRGVLRVNRLLALVTIPLFVGLSILSEPTIRMVFGENWVPAAPILAIVALIGPLQCMVMPAEQAVIASGRPAAVFIAKATFSVIGVLLLFAAVPWGVLAIAAVYVVRGYAVLLPIYLRLFRVAIDLKPVEFLATATRPLLASLVMASVVWFVQQSVVDRAGSLSILLVSAVAGAVTYAGVLLVIDPRGSRGVLRELRRLYG